MVHVGRRSPDVADDSFELFVLAHLADFIEHGLFRAGLNDTALMCGDGTKSASTKTPSHDRHGVLDHVEGWDGLGVARMGAAGVR